MPLKYKFRLRYYERRNTITIKIKTIQEITKKTIRGYVKMEETLKIGRRKYIGDPTTDVLFEEKSKGRFVRKSTTKV